MQAERHSAYSLATPSSNPPVQRILENGEAGTWNGLLDDGVAGDEVAGDGIFTSRTLVPEEETVSPVATGYPVIIGRMVPYGMGARA